MHYASKSHSQQNSNLDVIRGHLRSLEVIRRSNNEFSAVTVLPGFLAFDSLDVHYASKSHSQQNFNLDVIRGHLRSLEVIRRSNPEFFAFNVLSGFLAYV